MTTASHPVPAPLVPAARPDHGTVFQPRPAEPAERPASGGAIGWWRLWLDSGAWRDGGIR